MHKNTRNSLIGFALLGVGGGIAAVGIAMLVPAWSDWWFTWTDEAVQRGKDTFASGLGAAAEAMGEAAGRAQQKFSEFAEAARPGVAKAAETVEKAARRVRERTQ